MAHRIVAARIGRIGRANAALAASLSAVILLAGCANVFSSSDSGPSRKTAIAEAIAGADLMQAGQSIRLSENLLHTAKGVASDSVVPVLNEAANGLLVDGLALKTGTQNAKAVRKTVQSNLESALPSLQAMVSAYKAAGPDQAAHAAAAAAACRDAFLIAVKLYNQDAAAADLPTVKLPES